MVSDRGESGHLERGDRGLRGRVDLEVVDPEVEGLDG